MQHTYICTRAESCSGRTTLVKPACYIRRRKRVTQTNNESPPSPPFPPSLKEAGRGSIRFHFALRAELRACIRNRDNRGARCQRVVVSVRLPVLSTSEADADDLREPTARTERASQPDKNITWSHREIGYITARPKSAVKKCTADGADPPTAGGRAGGREGRGSLHDQHCWFHPHATAVVQHGANQPEGGRVDETGGVLSEPRPVTSTPRVPVNTAAMSYNSYMFISTV